MRTGLKKVKIDNKVKCMNLKILQARRFATFFAPIFQRGKTQFDQIGNLKLFIF